MNIKCQILNIESLRLTIKALSLRQRKSSVVFIIVLSIIILASWIRETAAFDEEVIIPADDPEGVVLNLPAGSYVAEVAGGAITLWNPDHPHYRWVYGLVVGTSSEGGIDEPNIGSLYVDISPLALGLEEAEKAILEALKRGEEGTSLNFTLEADSEVRFWVSDFDYTDNEGQEKVRIYLKGKE